MLIVGTGGLKNKLSLVGNYALFYFFYLFGYNLKEATDMLPLSEKLLQLKNQKIRKPYGYTEPTWLLELMQHFDSIQKEWNHFKSNSTFGEQIDEISKDQAILNTDKKWNSVFLFVYGHNNQQELQKFPTLKTFIQQNQNQFSVVFFSTTQSGKHIPPHHGNNHGVLRVQIGIDIQEPELCILRVNDKIIQLREGEFFIFDDTYEHELLNKSSLHRTVLIIDYFKPFPFLFDKINKKKVYKMKETDYVREVINKISSSC